MSRLLALLCAAAAVAAYFMQSRSFQAAEEASKTAPERVVIDGKFYPKNARGVYTVNGVTTFVKDDSKLAAAEKEAAREKPKRGEVIMDPAALDSRIDRGN